jgi:hypothetical protein
MTPNELKRRFPQASASCYRANAAAGSVELHPSVGSQSASSLVAGGKGKQAGASGGQERYRIHFTIYACQPLDWDNAAGSIKPIQDALVEAGWLPADDWKTLEGIAISKKANTKKEQRTVVTIERIA